MASETFEGHSELGSAASSKLGAGGTQHEAKEIVDRMEITKQSFCDLWCTLH